MPNTIKILKSLLENKHTSIAGALVALCLLGDIWLPQFSEQFFKTRQIAIAYGLLLSGDAVRKAREDTEILVKSEIKKEEP